MTTRVVTNDFQCPEYLPPKDSKRCRYFEDDRSCSLTAHPVCEEWLRLNLGKPIPNEASAAFVKANPDYVIAVVESLYFRPGWKAKMLDRLTSFDFPVRAPSSTPNEPARKPTPAPEPTPAQAAVEKQAAFTAEGLPSEIEVASFKALGVEVAITSAEIGEVWLVPKYTDANRKEITPEHLLTLCRLITAFPGCHVSEFIKTVEA